MVYISVYRLFEDLYNTYWLQLLKPLTFAALELNTQVGDSIASDNLTTSRDDADFSAELNPHTSSSDPHAGNAGWVMALATRFAEDISCGNCKLQQWCICFSIWWSKYMDGALLGIAIKVVPVARRALLGVMYKPICSMNRIVISAEF